ncbi:hypothetical protein PhaeoP48_01178 [Phaeobacter inhibens]|nr:hypothetical protein PhaeoP48_01178 [Phaeobacter inhibens]
MSRGTLWFWAVIGMVHAAISFADLTYQYIQGQRCYDPQGGGLMHQISYERANCREGT